MNRIPGRQRIFQPVTVLLVALLAAALFAFLVDRFFAGDRRWFLLYYFVPIAVPFVAYLFDRLEQCVLFPVAAWIIDLVVLIPALTRAFVPLPLVSGHALFLSYCLVATRSPVARITAFLVLLQVAYLKIFVTHDTALIGGVTMGCLAGVVFRRARSLEGNIPLEEGL